MKVKLEGYDDLTIEITEKEAQNILSKAINKSVTKAQKKLEKSITEEYFLSGNRVKKSIKVIRPKGGNSEAEIVVKSKVLGLESFKIRQTKTGVQAAVSKKKGWTRYEGAFIRNVRSFAGSEKGTGKTLYHEDNFKIRVFKRKDDGKLDAKHDAKHGASVAGIAGNDSIQQDVEKEFYDDLYKNINQELKKQY